MLVAFVRSQKLYVFLGHCRELHTNIPKQNSGSVFARMREGLVSSTDEGKINNPNPTKLVKSILISQVEYPDPIVLP